MLLVTGGAGYIGSHFIKGYLAAHPGAEVLVVDNLSTGHREAVSFNERIHFHQANIGDVEAMVQLMTQYSVDAVVHFAASCYVGESQLAPARYFQNNVVNSLNLFQAMMDCGVQKIVFSSSCATYGLPVSLPMDETHPQNPINVYGVTKLMVEEALRGYCLSQGWSGIALRYFNAAGADESGLLGEVHDPETHLIPNIFRAALGKSPAVELFGDDYETPDGTCVRDYIHVSDLGEAHCKAVARLETLSGFEAINLGTTVGASVKEILILCEEISGSAIPAIISPRRPGDPPRLVANAEKAQAVLGWQPRYTLRQTLETAWAWENSPQFPRLSVGPVL